MAGKNDYSINGKCMDNLQRIMSPEYLESRIDVLEEVMDVLLETSTGLLIDDKSVYLRLIAEVRTTVKDCRTIAKLLNEKSTENEQG